MHERSGRDRIGVLVRVLLHRGMAGRGGRGGHLGGRWCGGACARGQHAPIRVNDGIVSYHAPLATWLTRRDDRSSIIVSWLIELALNWNQKE